MSYSPSDRCDQCGKFQDCRCPLVEVLEDIDRCARCGHSAVDDDHTHGCIEDGCPCEVRTSYDPSDG